MIPDLAEACVARLHYATETGQSWDTALVTLTTPKGWKKPPKFPRGTLLMIKEDGMRVWHFKAQNVLAWLAANGLVNLELRDAP